MYTLVHKELTGQLNTDEALELKELRGNSTVETLSQDLSAIWSASKEYLPQKDWKKADAKEALMQRIRSEKAIKTAPEAEKSNIFRNITIGAAMLILGLAAIYYMTRPVEVEVKAPSQSIEYAMLDDDTKMWVGAGSEVTIAHFTTSERRVKLEGEAIFDVARDESRPFTIDLGNDVYAQVLGTSFKATSTHDGHIGSIAVREGKVRLFSSSLEGLDMILEAGDYGSIDPKSESQAIKKIDTPIILDSQEDISFINTPINEVFSSLSKYYGVEFDVKGDAKCLYTSPLVKNSTLQGALDVILATHEGLNITESARSTYIVSGSCD